MDLCLSRNQSTPSSLHGAAMFSSTHVVKIFVHVCKWDTPPTENADQACSFAFVCVGPEFLQPHKVARLLGNCEGKHSRLMVFLCCHGDLATVHCKSCIWWSSTCSSFWRWFKKGTVSGFDNTLHTCVVIQLQHCLVTFGYCIYVNSKFFRSPFISLLIQPKYQVPIISLLLKLLLS